jgi:hypothetical protein
LGVNIDFSSVSKGDTCLDRIKDAHVIRLIEQIGDHYQTNISNRFLRPLLLQLQLDKNTWDQIELLTEKIELFRYQGFHMDELYRQISACARFVELARHNLIPSLRSKLSAVPGGPDKILREMAASNFVSNLRVFAELLHELYSVLVEMDKADSRGKQPLYITVADLHIVERLLND